METGRTVHPLTPMEYQEWFDEKNKEMYRKEKSLVVNKEKYVGLSLYVRASY